MNRSRGRRRPRLIAAIAAIAVVSTTQLALAATPENDDFDSATLISSLPFTDTMSTVEATAAPDDPSTCFTTAYSVWYSYTPAVTTDVYTDLGTGGFRVAVFSGPRGSLTQVGCGNDFVQWRAEQDVTYHIMVAGSAGELIFSLYQAFPAANDDFDDAVVIGALPFSDTVPATNIRYSTSAADDPDCYGAGRTVWYSLATTSTVGIEASTSGSTYDTIVCVYRGVRGGLTQVAANDNASSEPFISTSRVRFVADAGVTYHIMVGSRGCCGGDLSFAVVESSVPSNDSLSSPTVISSLPFVDHVDTRTATASVDDPNVAGCQGNRYTVWYALTPAEATPVVADTLGSNYTTVIGVFTGTQGNLSTVTCDAGIYHGDGQARVRFSAQAGVTYYMMVGSYLLETGDLTFNVNRALDLEITINPVGTLTRSGAAVISGNLSCSLDVPVDMDGTVWQISTSRSESGIISMHGFVCVSPITSWSATVAPNNRRFMVGSATVYVQVGGCGPNNCDFATKETEVQLRRR